MKGTLVVCLINGFRLSEETTTETNRLGRPRQRAIKQYSRLAKRRARVGGIQVSQFLPAKSSAIKYPICHQTSSSVLL